MIWQRICLAIGLALGCAFWSQGAAAQASDSQASDPVVVPQGDDYGVAVPTNDSDTGVERVDHSAPASQGNGGPKVIVNVNLSTQRMHVQFPDGTDETWPIASGRPGLDTPDGKYKPQWVDPDHVSKEYDDAPMPYAIFFDLKGHAFHGSYQKHFGKAVSHGCVRLPVADAKKLFEAVQVSGAEIEITGRAPRKGGAYVARRQQREVYPPQPQYGYGYGYSYGGYQSAYPPYPARRAYRPPQQSFFGMLFGGN